MIHVAEPFEFTILCYAAKSHSVTTSRDFQFLMLGKCSTIQNDTLLGKLTSANWFGLAVVCGDVTRITSQNQNQFAVRICPRPETDAHSGSVRLHSRVSLVLQRSTAHVQPQDYPPAPRPLPRAPDILSFSLVGRVERRTTYSSISRY